MKRSVYLILIAVCLLLTASLPTVFASEDGISLVESGKTVWSYRVTDTKGFSQMDADWYKPGYDTSSWSRGVSPFGDRLPGGTDTGWAGDKHGIFLVTTFTLDDIPENTSLVFHMFYDNTASIYLNGRLIFAEKGWNDKSEDFVFSADTLVIGKNTLAVSLLDDVGGREFDLTATLQLSSGEEIEPPISEDDIPVTEDTPLITASKTVWQYQTVTTEGFGAMDPAWKTEGFDRSSWKQGTGPFGDYLKPQNAALSGWQGDRHGIFLVTAFSIEDLEEALKKSYYLEMFYDNGVSVYLNGLRIYQNSGWSTSYETIVVSLKNSLKEGNNLLAVSLLDNGGAREFDLSLFMTDKKLTVDLEVTDEELEEAGLPVIRIDTDNGDYVRSRLEYVDATMRFDNMDAYPDEDHLYTEAKGGRIEIRGRGNSTWNNGYPDGKPNTLGGDTRTRKVPYNIKLEEKTNLFGMGVSKKWVLLANNMDKSNLRNKLIYDLSGRMGMNYTESVFVNLVLNGEYMGVYALCEKVDIDLFDGAVTDFEDYAEDFAKALAKEKGYDKAWRSAFEDELCENLSWLTEETYKGYRVSDYVDLTGVSTKTGYLIEYDGYADEASFFTTNHGVPLKVSNLEGIKSNPAVFNELKNYFNEFEEALYSETFYNSKGKHYSEYLDMQSFVDYFILNTLILNVEFGYKSMYMVLGEDGKLTLGPCWDYDWSSGNPFLGANGQYNQWYNDGRAGNNKWYRKAYGDPWFVSLVRERYLTLGGAIDDMIDSMTYYEDYLKASTDLEYRKFKADPYETDFKSRTGGRSFADEVKQLRTFLINRKNWLDTQFTKRDPDIEGFGMELSNRLTLTLSGSSVKKGTAFDYSVSQSTGSAVLSYSASDGARMRLYVNGIFDSEQSRSSGTVSIPLQSLDEGVNVLTVMISRDNGTVLYRNYLSLTMPGEKQKAPVLGSFLPGSDEEETPEPPVIPETTVKPEEPITPETTVKPEEPITPETTVKPEEPITPETTVKPEEPDVPAPSVDERMLQSDALDIYLQTKAERDGDTALRLVFVADRDYLFQLEFLDVTVEFKTKNGSKTYRGKLALSNSSYTLCRYLTAEDYRYTAASGDLLFGNAFTDIPNGILTSVSVTVKDQTGETLLQNEIAMVP